MKQVLAILVVIAFVAALSSAASYHPTKDTFWRYDADPSGGGTNTYGGANAQRAGKGWQDGFYMDYDRAGILAQASAELGHTATAADFTSGAVVVTLQLMSTWGNTPTAYTPAYFTSSTAWTESGASFSNADQTAVPPVQWNGTGASLRDASWHLTSAGGQVWDTGDETYKTFTIPADTAAGFLFATQPGVGLCMRGETYGNNGACYSKEGIWVDGHTYAGPVLNVVVPEPCSMLLIAAGAVATMIRRRK